MRTNQSFSRAISQFSDTSTFKTPFIRVPDYPSVQNNCLSACRRLRPSQASLARLIHVASSIPPTKLSLLGPEHNLKGTAYS